MYFFFFYKMPWPHFSCTCVSQSHEIRKGIFYCCDKESTLISLLKFVLYFETVSSHYPCRAFFYSPSCQWQLPPGQSATAKCFNKTVEKMAPPHPLIEVDEERKKELMMEKRLRACRVNIIPRVYWYISFLLAEPVYPFLPQPPTKFLNCSTSNLGLVLIF